MPRKKQPTTDKKSCRRDNPEKDAKGGIEDAPGKTSEPTPECASCRFFRPDEKGKAPWRNTVDNGTCFLKPPVVNNGHFERPPVMLSDFCKEWEPREKGADA